MCELLTILSLRNGKFNVIKMTDGKMFFVPPNDENQRFDKLLNACTYELREAQDVEVLVFKKTLDSNACMDCFYDL